jgi:hypothetical protein
LLNYASDHDNNPAQSLIILSGEQREQQRIVRLTRQSTDSVTAFLGYCVISAIAKTNKGTNVYPT